MHFSSLAHILTQLWGEQALDFNYDFSWVLLNNSCVLVFRVDTWSWVKTSRIGRYIANTSRPLLYAKYYSESFPYSYSWNLIYSTPWGHANPHCTEEESEADKLVTCSVTELVSSGAGIQGRLQRAVKHYVIFRNGAQNLMRMREVMFREIRWFVHITKYQWRIHDLTVWSQAILPGSSHFFAPFNFLYFECYKCPRPQGCLRSK